MFIKGLKRAMGNRAAETVNLDTWMPNLDRTGVRILRSMEEFEILRDFWSSCPGPLDSDIDVFFPEERNISGDPSPRVLVLYRHGKPVALMAAKIVRERFSFKIGWLNLFRPQVNVFTVPYGGLRGDASLENCRKFVRVIIECLKNGDADMAFLRSVDAESALFRSVTSDPGYLFRDHFTPVRRHHKMKLQASVEKLYANLSGHERQRFRQLAKKLSHDFCGQITIDRIETLADLNRSLSVVEQIAKGTWQRAMGAGFSINESRLKSLKAQANRGWLRIYILYLAGKPCAFSIGALYRGVFLSEEIGYDPVYAKYSPGMYLLSRMLEEFCAAGVEMIDFGPSDEQYKRRFANIQCRETDLHIFAARPIGLILSAMRATTVLIKEPIRAFLNRTDLIQPVKRVWRSLNCARQRTRNDS